MDSPFAQSDATRTLSERAGALDLRVNAARPDLADIELRGRFKAERYVEGKLMRVLHAQAPVRKGPQPDATMITEALRGELLSVFDRSPDGCWAWVQLQEDRYVGWIAADAIGEVGAEPTHKVAVPRTLSFPNPDIKASPAHGLPFGAQLTVIGEAEDRNARYALVEPSGAVVVQHLARLGEIETDWTRVAESFLGAPYLWGGKTSLGLDCSGLVQVALRACGIPAPRDSDMQEAALGDTLSPESRLPQLQRGDLVFWNGHVGLMQDPETLLHANAYHMAVAAEPLREAVDRLSSRGAEITSVRRIAAL